MNFLLQTLAVLLSSFGRIATGDEEVFVIWAFGEEA
jgi:hypothetical protein